MLTRTCPVCGEQGSLKHKGSTKYRRIDGSSRRWKRWKCKAGCGSEWSTRSVDGGTPYILARTIIAKRGQPWAVVKVQQIRAMYPGQESPVLVPGSLMGRLEAEDEDEAVEAESAKRIGKRGRPEGPVMEDGEGDED
jgi:hypothetical protein